MSETHSETEPQERRGTYTLIKVTELTALKAELASCRECRANLDCLSRGAVPVRDDDLAQTWQQAQAALIEFKLWCRTDISRKAFDALHALEAALQPKDTAK